MQTRSLNGRWRATFSDGRTALMDVPGCFDAVAGRWDVADAVRCETGFALECEPRFARLRFGAVSYYCDVYANGARAGSHEGMWDEFTVDVSGLVHAGANALRVDVTKPGYHARDRFPLRQVLSGFIPDVLCTFGGLWDDVTLECAEAFFVDAHSAGGDMAGRCRLEAELDVRAAGGARALLMVRDAQGGVVARAQSVQPVQPGRVRLALDFDIPNARCWSPEEPYLYGYELELELGGQRERVSGTLGCRDVRAEGMRILMNGRPQYLRGVLHWGYYDDLIIPNPAPETIAAEIAGVKRYGFNAIKHCLYIPRREYLDAADRAGVMLWIELPLWLPEGTSELAGRIRREYPRILRQLAGHPSICVVSLGCELDASVDGALLSDMYALAKRSLRALVRDNSGSGECYGGLQVDWADFYDYHFYAELQNLENLIEMFTPGWRNTRPWLFGEFCDSDTMRDMARVRRARGRERLQWELDDPALNPISRLKPDFFLGKHERCMEQSGIRADYERLRALSCDHALTHRKFTLEQTRACPAISGYNVTALRDVPIATSGMFDDMLRPKFDPDAVRRVNDDAVLCPAWDLGRVWINADRVRPRERYNFASGGEYALRVLLSNYGADARGGVLRWRLMDGGRVLAQGAQEGLECPRGEVRELVRIACRLPRVDAPRTLRVEAAFDASGVHAENDWPVFVYPDEEPLAGRFMLYDPLDQLRTVERVLACERLGEGEPVPEDAAAVVTALLTPAVRAWVEAGGRAVLMQHGDGALPVRPVAFWREGMMDVRPHPIVRALRKECVCDELRYFSMAATSAIETDKLAQRGFSEVEPVLRRYDCREWYVSDYMVACRLGRGALVATTLRLGGGMGKQAPFIADNPGAAYLLRSALRYLVSGRGQA